MVQIVKSLEIKNRLGLHMRPAAYLRRVLENFSSTVTFSLAEKSADARSLIEVLMLGAPQNSVLKVVVDGEDAESVMQSIESAFESLFGEKE